MAFAKLGWFPLRNRLKRSGCTLDFQPLPFHAQPRRTRPYHAKPRHAEGMDSDAFAPDSTRAQVLAAASGDEHAVVFGLVLVVGTGGEGAAGSDDQAAAEGFSDQLRAADNAELGSQG